MANVWGQDASGLDLSAQDTASVLSELQSQLDAQQARIEELQSRLEIAEAPFGLLADEDDGGCTPGMIERVALAAEQPLQTTCDGTEAKAFRTLDYYADYDRGFVIRPFDQKKHPFDVTFNGWAQFRHHSFVTQSDSWTDNAGVTRSKGDRNAFDIERARLAIRGHVIDPRLSYFVQVDGDTDGGHMLDFFDYFWAWQATDRFQIQMGKRKVTASRQWLLGARHTRFADRPMANDFFRPDRTVGLFGIGEFAQHGHYQVMVGNGYRTANLPNSATDNRFTFAATSYVDPAGDFGSQIVDFQNTSAALWRLGHSAVYSPLAAQPSGGSYDEANFVRLSDGTRLTQTGAVTPGVSISEFDVWLYGVDFAWKRRGWSLTSEVFLRWVTDLQGDGAISNDELFQHGYYVEGGKFLVAKKLDLNLRYSRVDGDYGAANEYAVGMNWYPLSKSSLKVTFDVTQLDGSPLQNTASDILVGDNGTLFRTQFQAEF
ncbi:putative transmembrane protein [Rhodopirellula islandica]|uniref:Transmembrane protein n=1 Tax=Rhodopirellula islandica TaxID=595434 RepID=A0A0J1BJ19_RHOIS|nr:porin [Rhodopirellula islandica]KLU06535.1 putative transmembrane protein [Rhodopirellula islandica]